jgi:hypothetical protein
MQAAKPLRKERIKEKGHTCNGEQIRICQPLPIRKAIPAQFFADANAQYVTFRADAGDG